jgi:hypothetical protein
MPKQSIPKAITLSAVAIVAIAGTTLLAGSPVDEPAFPYHTNLAVPANLPEDDWTGGPRECDIPAGITTSCVFPD